MAVAIKITYTKIMANSIVTQNRNSVLRKVEA